VLLLDERSDRGDPGSEWYGVWRRMKSHFLFKNFFRLWRNRNRWPWFQGKLKVNFDSGIGLHFHKSKSNSLGKGNFTLCVKKRSWCSNIFLTFKNPGVRFYFYGIPKMAYCVKYVSKSANMDNELEIRWWRTREKGKQ
jgi:hypothetical protein